MKKIVFAMVLCSVLFSSAAAYAANKTVILTLKQKEVRTDRNIEVTGKIPVVDGLNNQTFQEKLNDLIERTADDKKEAAIKDKVLSIDFVNECWEYDKYLSVVIYTTTTIGSAQEEVDTFVIDKSKNEMVTLKDVLGVNAIPLVNGVIRNEIAKHPDQYNDDFDGIYEPQKFYIKNGIVTIVFDEYQIAAGAAGIVKFDISMKDITNFVLKADKYIVNRMDNSKMLPLRLVSEKLGYKISWDKSEEKITAKKGDFTASFIIGNQTYNKGLLTRQLDAAPEIINGSAWVPLSFFEAILSAAYDIDGNGDITISIYK